MGGGQGQRDNGEVKYPCMELYIDCSGLGIFDEELEPPGGDTQKEWDRERRWVLTCRRAADSCAGYCSLYTVEKSPAMSTLTWRKSIRRGVVSMTRTLRIYSTVPKIISTVVMSREDVQCSTYSFPMVSYAKTPENCNCLKSDDPESTRAVLSTTMKLEKLNTYRLHTDLYRQGVAGLVRFIALTAIDEFLRRPLQTLLQGMAFSLDRLSEVRQPSVAVYLPWLGMDAFRLIPKCQSVKQARDTSVRLVNGALMSSPDTHTPACLVETRSNDGATSGETFGAAAFCC